jgi:hypothetical protein
MRTEENRANLRAVLKDFVGEAPPFLIRGFIGEKLA